MEHLVPRADARRRDGGPDARDRETHDEKNGQRKNISTSLGIICQGLGHFQLIIVEHTDARSPGCSPMLRERNDSALAGVVNLKIRLENSAA